MLNLDDLYHINCITSIVFQTWSFVSSKIGLLFNKIVFKKTLYVLAQISISSNLQCLHNSHAALNAIPYIVCVQQFVIVIKLL